MGGGITARRPTSGSHGATRRPAAAAGRSSIPGWPAAASRLTLQLANVIGCVCLPKFGPRLARSCHTRAVPDSLERRRRAHGGLKPRAAADWHVLDKAIDRALTAVRAESPDSGACRSAVDEVVATIDRLAGKT